jgi:Zn-dependent M28 family amino/carboxypeptidase
MLVLVCVLLRVPGIDSKILTIVQFLPTAALILALPLLLDTALSSPVPGANDNASGVAAAMELAERFGGELEHFDVNVLLTGSQEAMALGMRGYLKKRKGELEEARTVFLNLDELGRGTVRFTTREGLLMPIKSHTQLVSLCEEIVEDQLEEKEAEEDDDEDKNAIEAAMEDDEEDKDSAQRVGIRGMVARTCSDGYAARSAGFPSITITCKGRLDYTPSHHQRSDTPESVDDEAIERALDFTSELMRRLDDTVGPDLDRPAAETLLKEED